MAASPLSLNVCGVFRIPLPTMQLSIRSTVTKVLLSSLLDPAPSKANIDQVPPVASTKLTLSRRDNKRVVSSSLPLTTFFRSGSSLVTDDDIAMYSLFFRSLPATAMDLNPLSLQSRSSLIRPRSDVTCHHLSEGATREGGSAQCAGVQTASGFHNLTSASSGGLVRLAGSF